eukprot:10255890-Alexandrium_andersonii.AAC.1
MEVSSRGLEVAEEESPDRCPFCNNGCDICNWGRLPDVASQGGAAAPTRPAAAGSAPVVAPSSVVPATEGAKGTASPGTPVGRTLEAGKLTNLERSQRALAAEQGTQANRLEAIEARRPQQRP